MTQQPSTPAPTNGDAIFCEKICGIAKANGWSVDHMHSSIGHSFAFVHAQHGRVAGDISNSPGKALANACKKLLPHIYLHL